ncbi:NUDIX domain-containing protein [Arthrobacter sp. NicSoilB8]|uniref:NUDIX domain-containing protein n=1 Tax=Arthrobacter sp. NicSoilB8 TaxID=2830998 RepID=UPI001CC766EC|nr:NUDIX domain-containing protein [Arthrobacter sp. NicSoilB8]
MSITAEVTGAPAPVAPAARAVVAVVIEWRGKIALLKRSRHLNHDRGRWHCVTGFLEADVSPRQQASRELFEETGLRSSDLLGLRQGPALLLNDDSGRPWVVHTFTAVAARRRLEIDWEHDSYRWTAPGKTRRFTNRVSWLDVVLGATGHLGN